MKEKEQINQFNQMSQNISKMIDFVNIMNKKSKTNVDVAINNINTVCDKMATVVEQLRKQLSEKVLFAAMCAYTYILYNIYIIQFDTGDINAVESRK